MQNKIKSFLQEKEEVLNLINGQCSENCININLYEIVQKEITKLHKIANSEKEKYDNEKSLLLEKCIESLENYNEELPKEIQEIPEVIKKLLEKKYKQNNKLNIIIKKGKHDLKYKNYEDAFNQMVNGGKLRKEIAEFIKSRDDWWYLEKGYNEAKKEEIINVLELVKYSEKITKLTFTENPNFDAECERAYLDAIKTNDSLITIILYLTNVSKEVTLEMLKMLEIKVAIKVLVVEKAKIQEKDAQELAKKMKLEINNWESKYWRKIKKGKKYKFQ